MNEIPGNHQKHMIILILPSSQWWWCCHISSLWI